MQPAPDVADRLSCMAWKEEEDESLHHKAGGNKRGGNIIWKDR